MENIHTVIPWQIPLIRKGTVCSEMAETTPFVFNGRLYRVENWQKYLEIPGSQPGDSFMEDEVRIWDVETQQVISVPFVGHSFGHAFVFGGRIYVYGTRHTAGKPWRTFTEVDVVSSDDLINWSAPQTAIQAETVMRGCIAGKEHLFNVAVCRDSEKFVLLYETDDPQWPAFTFKYCVSDDLVNWKRVPDGIYGKEKYVGGPALYYEGGWYYTLYLQDLNGYSGGTFETRITRSKDLVHWQDAPVSRPFLAPDRSRTVSYNHFGKAVQVAEINASDAELCYWQGKTIVYFNGGDQLTCGDLQEAEFIGTPQQLLEAFYTEPEDVVLPDARQANYQTSQFGTFIHFGTPTIADENERKNWWGMLPTPAPERFNPEKLDANQWMETVKAMGASHVVLTTKHHSGFCLWPTDTTDYSVKYSSWKNGRGDILREFVDAARQHGIAPGFYFSCGDMQQGCHSTPEPQGHRKLVGDIDRYFEIVVAQLNEILTGYGDLCIIWLDGAFDPFGADVLGPDGKPLGTVWADEIASMIHKYQPGAVIMGGSQPDVRWCGNEDGVAQYPIWNVVKEGQGIENWLPANAHGWFIPEADVFVRDSWFWYPNSDNSLRSAASLMDVYLQSIGHGANLLMNLTPDDSGVIPAAEMKRMKNFGDEICRKFSNPIAVTDSNNRWREGNVLELTLENCQKIEYVSIEEDLQFGQRVYSYQIEAFIKNCWQVVANGESIGRRRIQSLKGVTTDILRLRIIETESLPKIRQFACY